MEDLNADGMDEITKRKAARGDALNKLMSKPFDVKDKEQLQTIKKYIDEFEYVSNQMFLIKGISNGLKAWGASWVIGRILPLPEFVNPIFAYCLYFGVASWLLGGFRENDFHSQVEEMKSIYNWCLKGGKTVYDESDTSNKLNLPEIQHLIEVLAPLCRPDFMRVWPKVTAEAQTTSGVWAIVDSGQKFYSHMAGFFYSAPEQSDKLKTLKIKIENDECKLNALTGADKAIRYFISSPYFKEIMMEKVMAPVQYVKDKIPEVITSSLTHQKIA